MCLFLVVLTKPELIVANGANLLFVMNLVASEVRVQENRSHSRKGLKLLCTPQLLHWIAHVVDVIVSTDGFFLCRALQHIYEATKRFSIQWLEQDAQDENAYDLAYTDTLDPECILTDVRLKKVNKDKYTLPLNQRQRVEKALAKSVEGRDSSDEDESDSGDHSVWLFWIFYVL